MRGRRLPLAGGLGGVSTSRGRWPLRMQCVHIGGRWLHPLRLAREQNLRSEERKQVDVKKKEKKAVIG